MITALVEFINRHSFFKSNLIRIIDKINPDQNLENKALTTLFKSSKENIKKQLPAMIALVKDKYTLGTDPKSKLHIITSDYNKYNKLFSEYKVDPTEHNTTDLTDLKDVILYYQEYATTTNVDDNLLDLTRHLNTMVDIKQHIADTLERNDKGETDTYVKKKSPYFSREGLNKLIS